MFHALTKGLTFLQNTILLTLSFFFLWLDQLLLCITEAFVLSSSPWLFSQSCSQLVLCLDKVLAPEGTHTAASVCPLLHSKLQPYSQPELIIGAKSQQSVHQNNMSLWPSAVDKAGILRMSLICMWLFIQHLQLRNSPRRSRSIVVFN